MSGLSFEVGGLVNLAADIDKGALTLAKAARDMVEETAIDLRDEWRANATETAGRHGKHYPASINYRMRGLTSIGADIEPDESMKQGAMSFEFGSMNQPPHLDGQRALDAVAPRFARRVDALEFL